MKIRRFGAGLADQVVVAAANAGNSLLALLLLPDPSRAGVLVIALAVGYATISLNRAFVGEVLLALAPRLEPAERERLIRDGLAAALAVGVLGAAILGAAWAVSGPGSAVDLRDLGWIALVLPVGAPAGHRQVLAARAGAPAARPDQRPRSGRGAGRRRCWSWH